MSRCAFFGTGEQRPCSARDVDGVPLLVAPSLGRGPPRRVPTSGTRTALTGHGFATRRQMPPDPSIIKAHGRISYPESPQGTPLRNNSHRALARKSRDGPPGASRREANNPGCTQKSQTSLNTDSRRGYALVKRATTHRTFRLVTDCIAPGTGNQEVLHRTLGVPWNRPSSGADVG